MLAYDIDLLRPGCVLIQAGLGGSSTACNRFPTESWLLFPTPGMRLYAIPNADLEKAIDLAWTQFGEKETRPKAAPRRRRTKPAQN